MVSHLYAAWFMLSTNIKTTDITVDANFAAELQYCVPGFSEQSADS